MAEESLIPSVLCMSGPPLPEWAQNTGTRQADENGSACVQEIFSQDNKLLAQLLTVPVSAAGSRPPPRGPAADHALRGLRPAVLSPTAAAARHHELRTGNALMSRAIVARVTSSN